MKARWSQILFFLCVAPLVVSACQPATTQSDAARQALEGYFAALQAGDWQGAADRYAGDYESLTGFNPEIDPADHAALFQAACQINGYRCDLQLDQVLGVTEGEGGAITFTVSFKNPDGSAFTLGPCCGADPTESPPVSEFEFRLISQGGNYQVLDLPVYVP